MPTLSDLLPDLTSEAVALAIARRAIRKDGEDDGLRDYLVTTAAEKSGEAYYRPYAAARGWLKAHPRWLEKAEGAEWRTLDEALAGLAEQQARLDAALGLELPEHLDDAEPIGLPGPAFTAW